ncbi:unnamed protein product [Plutella xylostella]|uniref:(diamondback moth) hypothetical protein n=1 Tax=Plutella xylostella TaxID=51655 RepID=A0A8S4DN20_PLUXY|nr:unnamed protein product [Plutella xylostella]
MAREPRRRLPRRHAAPRSSKHLVLESIKGISKEYCAESSICGLKHLVDVNIPYFERVIWAVTMVGALICSVSLVWMTFTRYYMAPLVTTQVPEGISVSEIIFPAVGICSTNRISKRAVTELAKDLLQEPRNKEYNESEMMSMLLGLGQLYDLQMISSATLSDPEQLHDILGDYDTKTLMRNLTPTCESLLLRCSWNEKAMNCSELFDFRMTMNGYCCTFNYLRDSEEFDDRDNNDRNIDSYNFGNKSTFDFDQGLKVLLRYDRSDDFYYNIPLLGAQMQFSDAYDFPDAPSGSFSVQIISPSVQMTVLVTASLTEASRDIEHVSVNVRGCLFHDESSYLPFYTHSDCMLKCRMLFLVKKCNCTPFNMPSMRGIRTCNLADVHCLRIYYAQSITVRPDLRVPPPELELDLVRGGIACPQCLPTCSKTAYNYEFNNVKMDPDTLNNPSSIYDREAWLRGSNFSETSIVHVKYAGEFADCYGQNVIMKWFDLFSNIGSTCGFVTGFSFVSVLEFIYFFTIKLTREVRAKRRALQAETKAPVTSFKEPVTRYRPIYWNELRGGGFTHTAQINH